VLTTMEMGSIGCCASLEARVCRDGHMYWPCGRDGGCLEHLEDAAL
jgi:hypothetical protein